MKSLGLALLTATPFVSILVPTAKLPRKPKKEPEPPLVG